MSRPPAVLPDIPPGTRLVAGPGEWCPRIGVRSHHPLHVRVVDVRALNAELAWVRGHGLECSWESADCTAPWCHEVLVSVEVVRRAVPSGPAGSA